MAETYGRLFLGGPSFSYQILKVIIRKGLGGFYRNMLDSFLSSDSLGRLKFIQLTQGFSSLLEQGGALDGIFLSRNFTEGMVEIQILKGI